jgi:ApaG protein
VSDTTTRGVRIQVKTAYLPDKSAPDEGRYLFAYRIRISNVGDETVQLISREWIITDSDGDVETVRGPGVVGEQPVLDPGQSFEYTSFCPLPTPIGSMHGSYQMVAAGGQTFDATIAPFSLAVPNALN